jgi:hypothetical protein
LGIQVQKTLHLAVGMGRIRKKIFAAQHQQLIPAVGAKHLLNLLGVEPSPFVVIGLALSRWFGGHQGLNLGAVLNTALHLMALVGDGPRHGITQQHDQTRIRKQTMHALGHLRHPVQISRGGLQGAAPSEQAHSQREIGAIPAVTAINGSSKTCTSLIAENIT